MVLVLNLRENVMGTFVDDIIQLAEWDFCTSSYKVVGKTGTV